MPLQPDQKEDFVQIKVVNVASDENVIEKDESSNDFKVRLTDVFTNVIAMEIENYQVPLTSLSQFTDANYVDFRLRNPKIFGGQWKTFTAVFPVKPVIYNTPRVPNADIISTVFETFSSVLKKDPDFGSKVDIVPLPDTKQNILLVCRTLVYPPLADWPGFGSTECEFLFSSGTNSEKSAAEVLGFEKQDYTFQPLVISGIQFQYLASPFPIQVNKYRYLDIFIDEVPEFQPFYRVFVPSVTSVSITLPENAGRVRLMRQPLRRLETLTIRLRLPGGLKPFTLAPYFFSFRVFTLNSSYILPEKEKNRIKLV